MSKQKPPIWMKTAEKGPAGAPIKADVSSRLRKHRYAFPPPLFLPRRCLATWIARRSARFHPYRARSPPGEENPGETGVEIMKQTTTRRRKSALGWQRREFRLFTTFRVHIYYGPPPPPPPNTLPPFFSHRAIRDTYVGAGANVCFTCSCIRLCAVCLCVSPSSRQARMSTFVRLSNIITLWNENSTL